MEEILTFFALTFLDTGNLAGVVRLGLIQMQVKDSDEGMKREGRGLRRSGEWER